MSVEFEQHHQGSHSSSLGYGYQDWGSAGGGGSSSISSSSSSYETRGDSWNRNSSSSLLATSLPTSLTLPHLRHHHHSRNHGSNGGTSPLSFSGTNNMFGFSANSGNGNNTFPHTTSNSYYNNSEASRDGSSSGSSSASGGIFGANETFSESNARFLSLSPKPSSSNAALSQLSSHSSFPTSHWASGVTNRENNLDDITPHINYNGPLEKLNRFGHKMEHSTTAVSSSSMTHLSIAPHHHHHHHANKSFASSTAASIEQFVNKPGRIDDVNNINFRNYTSHNLSLELSFDGMGDFQVEDNISTSYSFNVTSILDPNGTTINATNATKVASSFQESVYVTILPIMLFFCILAVLINLLIVISARWCRKPMSPTLYFSISLALADAYAAMVLAVGLVINSLLPVVFNYREVPVCFSLIVEAFRQGGILVTVSHLLALAMNHWIGIVRPLHYAATMTRRTAWTVIIFSWICPITIIFIYYSSISGEGFQAFKEGCKTYNFLLERTYRAFFASCFFAPLILMSFIYIHIFIIVRNHHTHRQRYQVKEKNSQQLKRNVKAVLTTMLVLGTYIIGWAPACLYSLIVCKNCIYDMKSLSEIVRLSFGIICNLLVILKTLVDPIIYAARMSDIQMALKRMRYDIMSKLCKSCAPEAPPNDRGCSKFNRSFYDTKSMRMSSFGSHSTSSRRMHNVTSASVRINGSQMNHTNHQQSHKQLPPHNGMMITGSSNGYLPCATEIRSHPGSNMSCRRSFVQSNQPQPLITSKSTFEMAEIN